MNASDPNGTYLSQKHKEGSVRCAHERSDKVPLGCARFIVCPVSCSDVRTAHATYKDVFEGRTVFSAFKA